MLLDTDLNEQSATSLEICHIFESFLTTLLQRFSNIYMVNEQKIMEIMKDVWLKMLMKYSKNLHWIFY